LLLLYNLDIFSSKSLTHVRCIIYIIIKYYRKNKYLHINIEFIIIFTRIKLVKQNEWNCINLCALLCRTVYIWLVIINCKYFSPRMSITGFTTSNSLSILTQRPFCVFALNCNSVLQLLKFCPNYESVIHVSIIPCIEVIEFTAIDCTMYKAID